MAIEITKNVSIGDLENVFGGVIPRHHPDDYIQSRLRDKMVFTAKKDGDAIGFLIYNIWWGNCPFIELIKIRENSQKQGIGKALLKEAATEIKNKNFKTLISSSEVINDVGKDFHTKCNFEKLNTLNLPHGEEQFFTIDLDKLCDPCDLCGEKQNGE